MTPLLELKRIKKSFPGVKALDGIDLAIQRGEVHALLGENGAGKSTLVKIMCGIYQPDEGDIFIDGEQRRFNNYRQAIEAGVGIIFQEFSLIPYMSAIDNIFLNREIRNRWGLLDRRAMRRKAEAIFKRLTVAIDLDCPVEQLSVAQQQFVEIAKALSLEARVLVLDEPTATLTPGEAEHLFSV
ncbi:MAG: ATP-binding cassette domain-containing protein, partial [Serratia marcescens]|nr:ATP-binding cassette domain-containing protein [Serratia marcescens]